MSSIGIHVRLVRDEGDVAIHEAEYNHTLPSESLAFQTYFYEDENAAVKDYVKMANKLQRRYDEENGFE